MEGGEVEMLKQKFPNDWPNTKAFAFSVGSNNNTLRIILPCGTEISSSNNNNQKKMLSDERVANSERRLLWLTQLKKQNNNVPPQLIVMAEQQKVIVVLLPRFTESIFLFKNVDERGTWTSKEEQ